MDTSWFVLFWQQRKKAGIGIWLIWSALIGIIVTAITIWIMSNGHIAENHAQLLLYMIISVISGSCIGILMGIGAWRTLNRRYLALITGDEIYLNDEERTWRGKDKIWDKVIVGFLSVSFILFYLTIFATDAPNHPKSAEYALEMHFIYYGILISYFLYRFLIRGTHGDRIVPGVVKFAFILELIILCILYVDLFSGWRFFG